LRSKKRSDVGEMTVHGLSDLSVAAVAKAEDATSSKSEYSRGIMVEMAGALRYGMADRW